MECFFLSYRSWHLTRHDFRSPNPNILALAYTRQSFHFQKILWGLNFNIFCENWHEASFYIKEQAQIFFWNLSFQNYIFFPPNRHIFCFWRKAPQIFFFSWVSALKTVDQKILFWLVFFKMYFLKGINRPNRRVEHPFFSEERNVLAFFSVLYKRMEHFLHSFPFFINERNDLCVLSHSL